jgi:hypothetical protein
MGANKSLQPINEIMLDGYDISNGFVTDYFCVYDCEYLSIQAIIQNGIAPTGIFTLSVSSELYFPIQFDYVLGSYTVSVNDNSIIVWNFLDVAYNWVKLTFQYASGSGEATVIFNKKVRF